MTGMGTTAQETPLLLGSGPNNVFAVGTEPVGLPNGIGVGILPGAGIPCFGNARAWVEVARRLAAHGYRVIRLDYCGVGDSTGDVEQFSLIETFTGDVVAAGQWLQQNGAAELALIGECYGARVAIDALAELPAVRGVVALFPPLTVAESDTEQAALETAHFADSVGDGLRRGVSVRVVYGADDVDLGPFRAAVGQLRRVHSGLSLCVVKEKLHGIPSTTAKQAVIRSIHDALSGFFGSHQGEVNHGFRIH